MTTKITADNLAPALATVITQGGGPKISNVTIADSSYNTLDDLAVSTSGGYIKILGSGFSSGCQVTIGTTLASSVTFISSSEIRAQVPSKSSGSYPVYVTNTDGGTGVRINGLSYSEFPAWGTGSALGTKFLRFPFSFSLSANSDSNVIYSLAPGSSLPANTILLSNGLIFGNVITQAGQEVTYNFTVLATDQELQNTNSNFSIVMIDANPEFNIVPSVDGKSLWNLSTDGPLSLSTVGEYAVTTSSSFTLSLKMWGAGGARGGPRGNDGGGGGYAEGSFTMLPNVEYRVRVGGAGGIGPLGTRTGGYNGGGTGGPGTNGGGGGGFSAIFAGTNTQSNVIIAAGAGGGSSANNNDPALYSRGGAGGGTQAQDGGNSYPSYPNEKGLGANVISAGQGGTGSGSPWNPINAGDGQPGSALQGGNGGVRGGSGASGGGGGGGYFGGGGGGGNVGNDQYGGGGGGGSGYISPLATGTLIAGFNQHAGANTSPVRGNAGSGATTEDSAGANGLVYIYFTV